MNDTKKMTTTYQSLSQLEHLKMRTAMYTGSITSYETTMPIWNGSKMSSKTVQTNDGLMKLFFEAVDNSVDNTHRTPATTHIRVTMNDTSFKIENDGSHIPVKQQNGTWIPTMIFSEFLSGSNYHEEREGVGQNGLGIKLAAGLSDHFKITILDPEQCKKFVQSWEDGLTKTNKPKISQRV